MTLIIAERSENSVAALWITLDHFGSLDVSGCLWPVKGALIIELVDVDRLKKRQTLEVVKMAEDGRAGHATSRHFVVCFAVFAVCYDDFAVC